MHSGFWQINFRGCCGLEYLYYCLPYLQINFRGCCGLEYLYYCLPYLHIQSNTHTCILHTNMQTIQGNKRTSSEDDLKFYFC